MNKAILALTTLAVSAIAPVALADEPTDDPSSTSGSEKSTSAPTTGQTQTGPTQTGPTQTGQVTVTTPPIVPTPVPTSRTTLTGADVSPMPPSMRRQEDTITVQQSSLPNRPLLYTGGLIFLGSYATTAALTATNVERGNADRTMYLPVVGPWLHLADIQESATDTALIVGSGVLQGVGVMLAAASLVVPEKVPAATIQAGSVKINVTATSFGSRSGGIGAVGQF